MASRSVEGRLRRASEDLADICETVELPDVTEQRLRGKAEQLRYLADADPVDPEAVANPDPDSLDTIREHLTAAMDEVDEDTAVRLERVCGEVLGAISILVERREKQRHVRDEPT